MGRVSYLQLAFFQLLALTTVYATADAREASDRPSANRMVFQSDEVFAQSGTLSCPNNGENTGAACALQFQPHGTKRIYSIGGDLSSAMRLYLDGQREVSIQGSTRGQFLRVSKINSVEPATQYTN